MQTITLKHKQKINEKFDVINQLVVADVRNDQRKYK